MNASKKILLSSIALASGSVALAAPAAMAQADSNDNFGRARTLQVADPITDPTLYESDGDNFDATRQRGERGFLAGPSRKTVWFKWTAPANWATVGGPTVTVDTAGSDFDTVLSVYNASRVRALGPGLIAENDDANATLQSSVTFTPVAGTTYRLQVDGFGGQEGNIDIQAHP
jgi:hypothetical protein